jgi:predicted AlkP superfamily pyrophosphatase or phosphodiesterase
MVPDLTVVACSVVTRRATCLAVVVALVAALAPRPTAQPPAPLVLLIGIAGYRPDYLERADVPALRRLAARGLRAAGLVPPFPSKTFPSFTSMATGLVPARHGIVSNTIDDPAIPGRFRLADHDVRSDPRWWRGEPIWNTAGRQGLRTAGLFWPGDDVDIGGRRPTDWLPYDESLPNDARVARVLGWLARPAAERPALVTLYFSLVDETSHAHGPFAAPTLAAAAEADRLVGSLVEGVTRLGLDARATYVVVSDHGMAETTLDRTVLLDDYVDLARVEVLDAGPFLGLRPTGPAAPSAAALVAALRAAPHLQVWTRAEVPARYRYDDPGRIPPVVGVADDGWQVLTRAARDRWRAAGGRPRGEHGYAPEVTNMQGLFVAAGPALKAGVRVPAFDNIHVYALLCRLLGVMPAANDGDPAVTAGFLR